MRIDALATALDELKRTQHPAEIHLHHPDRAESRPAPSCRRSAGRVAAAGGGARRADLRGRLLCRPDLGRPAAAGDLRHERAAAASSISARSRSRSRRRCASATSWRRGRCCRARSRSRPTAAPARSSRWCWRNSARRISRRMCRSCARGLRAKLEDADGVAQRAVRHGGRVRRSRRAASSCGSSCPITSTP